MTIAQRDVTVEKTVEVALRFPVAFDPQTAPHYCAKVRNFYTNMPGIAIRSHTCTAGEFGGMGIQ
jgi:hypothetical protein